MRIQGANGITTVVKSAPAAGPAGDKGFAGVLERIRGAAGMDQLIGVRTHQEIGLLQKEIMAGKNFTARDLLLYQIKVGRFGLQVELLSKVAEGMMTAVRKLQGGQ